jgi:hypothetical protein
VLGRRLLEIVVYDKGCRIGGTLTLDDLAETSEIGDWMMPQFRMACSYAASQGWLIARAVQRSIHSGDRCESTVQQLDKTCEPV